MQIRARYGCDTGMCLLDVLLETPEERSLDDEAVWRTLGPLLDAQRIPPLDVEDFFRHVRDSRGHWIPVSRDEQGNLVWWDEQGEPILVHRVT